MSLPMRSAGGVMSSAKIDFAQIRFLIIDPHPLSADLLKDVLQMLGAVGVVKCASSERAIELLRQEPFDIVITELETTPMNGFEFVHFIRTSGNSPNRLLPIIMLTARSEREYVAEARDQGITEFLAKPFTIDALYKRLIAVIARPRQFVDATTYFGPDRRRRPEPFQGPDRREAGPQRTISA